MTTTSTSASASTSAVSGTMKHTETEIQAHRDVEVPTKRPAMMTLTDSDTTVLSLCRLNCEFNFGPKKEYQLQNHSLNNNNNGSGSNNCDNGNSDSNNGDDGGGGCIEEEEAIGLNYRVCHLDWGGSPLFHNKQQHCHHQSVVQQHKDDVSVAAAGSQDTVIVTDVIYDLSTIPILFQTASSLLKTKNNNTTTNVDECNDHDIDYGLGHDIRTALEERILNEATKHGFLTFGSTQTSNSSPFELYQVFYDSNDDDDNNNNNNKHAIIRPNNLIDLWENEVDIDFEQERSRPQNIGMTKILIHKQTQKQKGRRRRRTSVHCHQTMITKNLILVVYPS